MRLVCCVRFNVILFCALHRPLIAKAHGVTSVVPDQRPLTLVTCALVGIFVATTVATDTKSAITIVKRFTDRPFQIVFPKTSELFHLVKASLRSSSRVRSPYS